MPDPGQHLRPEHEAGDERQTNRRGRAGARIAGKRTIASGCDDDLRVGDSRERTQPSCEIAGKPVESLCVEYGLRRERTSLRECFGRRVQVRVRHTRQRQLQEQCVAPVGFDPDVVRANDETHIPFGEAVHDFRDLIGTQPRGKQRHARVAPEQCARRERRQHGKSERSRAGAPLRMHLIPTSQQCGHLDLHSEDHGQGLRRA